MEQGTLDSLQAAKNLLNDAVMQYRQGHLHCTLDALSMARLRIEEAISTDSELQHHATAHKT